MEYMKTKLVIFDFDGVLTDSYDVCIGVSKQFFPELTDESYKVLFTGNIYEALEKGKDANVKVTKINNDLYFEIYEPLILEVPPREGFKEILEGLISKGVKIAFVSSCYTKPLTNYLIKYGFIDYVTEVIGGDIEKSKVKKFIKLLDDQKVSADECIFITDTLGDLIEAEKVNLPTFGVTFGFHDRVTLEKGKSIGIFDSVEDLGNMISNLQ